MVLVAILFPETNRSIVGDGSNPPQRWNRSFLQLFQKGRLAPNPKSIEKKVTGVNPFKSLRILADRENLILCIYGGLLFAGFSATTGVFASQLDERYHLNQVQAGLCYLPLGFGSILSRWTVGKLIDWNFKREAQRQRTIFSSPL